MHQAATRADDYALTHKSSFCKPPTSKNKSAGEARHEQGEGQDHQTHMIRAILQYLDYHLVPHAIYYCKQRGHIKAECPALERKRKSNAIVAPTRPDDEGYMDGSREVPSEYKPFVSHGTVSLGSGEESPVTILRDTGASQSLILADILPFSADSATRASVLLQGVELGTVNVPLYKMTLKCNLGSGPVIVGVRPSLPVQGITVLLGNDLAGGRVLQSPQVTVVPQMRCDDVTKQTQELFPACAVTRAMARARSSPIASSEQDNVHTLHNTGDTDLSILDMSLGCAAADVPTSSSDLENPKVN